MQRVHEDSIKERLDQVPEAKDDADSARGAEEEGPRRLGKVEGQNWTGSDNSYEASRKARPKSFCTVKSGEGRQIAKDLKGRGEGAGMHETGSGAPIAKRGTRSLISSTCN